MLAHLFDRAREPHAPSLAAATRVYLRFDDPEIPAERLGGRDGLCGRRDNAALGHGNAELGKQCLGLILVEVHKPERP